MSDGISGRVEPHLGGGGTSEYFRTRLALNPHRAAVWQHICRYLRSWCYGAKRSRLQPIKDFVKLVETHWDGIVGWHDSRISLPVPSGDASQA